MKKVIGSDLRGKAYIEYCMASMAVCEGKKSLQVTSLFSFFLSVYFCWLGEQYIYIQNIVILFNSNNM